MDGGLTFVRRGLNPEQCQFVDTPGDSVAQEPSFFSFRYIALHFVAFSMRGSKSRVWANELPDRFSRFESSMRLKRMARESIRLAFVFSDHQGFRSR